MTTQWLSVPGLDPEAALALELPRCARARGGAPSAQAAHRAAARRIASRSLVRELDADGRGARAGARSRACAARACRIASARSASAATATTPSAARALLARRERGARPARRALPALGAAGRRLQRGAARRAAAARRARVRRRRAGGRERRALRRRGSRARGAARGRLRDQRDRADLRHARDRAAWRALARASARPCAALGIDPEAKLAPPAGLRVRGARRALRVRPDEASLASATRTPGSCASRCRPAATRPSSSRSSCERRDGAGSRRLRPTELPQRRFD